MSDHLRSLMADDETRSAIPDVGAVWAAGRRRRAHGRIRRGAVAVVVLAGLIGGGWVAQTGNGSESIEVATTPDPGKDPGQPLPTASTAVPVPEPSDPDVTTGSPSGPGDGARWRVNPDAPPSRTSTAFDVGVMRIGCAGGMTGEVLEPEVEFTSTAITITYEVEPLGTGAVPPCPGNDTVTVRLDLGQRVGDRALVDGGCRERRPVLTLPLDPEFGCNSGGLDTVRWPA